jgi:hypothetical protein
MSLVVARDFLASQIPIGHQVLIPPVLKQAYAAAKTVRSLDELFRTPSAQDGFGRLVSWAVDLFLVKLIESGRWPVDYAWREYGIASRRIPGVLSKVTGHYLEVILPHARMTISQVVDPQKQPRDVQFRENARLVNAPLLRGLDIEMPQVTGVPTFILAHGHHQDLRFAHLGAPHQIHRYGYIYQTPDLLLLPHEVPADNVGVENTTFDDDAMTLKADIDKWRKDNAG